MTEPLVSVVTVCYGAEYRHHLEGAMLSVSQQTFENWEHVIVTDVPVVEDARIKSVPINHHDHIEGCNIGAAAARGRYLVILDADDRLAPTYMTDTLSAVDTTNPFAIAQTDLQEFGDNSGRWNCPEYNQSALLKWNIIPISSIVTKALWDAVGGYELGTFGYEDWNFWIAASEFNPSVAHVPEALFLYRTHLDGLCLFQGRHDLLLKSMMKIMHADLYPAHEVVEAERAVASMSEEAADILRRRFEWFPENKHLRRFLELHEGKIRVE